MSSLGEWERFLTQRTHELKILPEYFQAVRNGNKTFEIRKNDRGYAVGDRLILREYDNGRFTGETEIRYVSYVLDDATYLQEGYVALGLIYIYIKNTTFL